MQKTLGKKGYQPKPCHFQMMTLMRCLSSHDNEAAQCLVEAQKYHACMKNAKNQPRRKGNTPNGVNFSMRKKKLRKRGPNFPD